MARNEEKHYGRLNRLYLLKEKEEYEKKNPPRPKLVSLHSAEEIQKWLPSIKKDIDFYLKKSQVVCYSDQHIEECRMKVVQFEKEYKAFVRKLAQLSSGTLAAIPWTNRAYKRRNADPVNTSSKKGFIPIACPVLDRAEPPTETETYVPLANTALMDKPLSFNTNFERNQEKELFQGHNNKAKFRDYNLLSSEPKSVELTNSLDVAECKTSVLNIVNYDSSSESDGS